MSWPFSYGMFSSQGLSLKSTMLYYFLDFIWKGFSLYISWTLFYACHFMKRQLKVLVTPSRPTLCNPMDCSLPASSVHEVLQARIMEWVTIPFSRGSSWPQGQTQISCIVDGFFYHLSHLGSHLMKGQLIWPQTNFNLHLSTRPFWMRTTCAKHHSASRGSHTCYTKALSISYMMKYSLSH